jgi:threonine/homoserine/homoserine lactone efflux protein
MVPADRLIAFLGAAVLVTLAPGPDILYVLTRGMAQGRRVALAAAGGFALGNVVHTTLAALGLSAVLTRAPAAFQTLKLVGAAYLIVLGVKMWRDHTRLSVAAAKGEQPAGQVFRQSVLANVLNPKVAVFFVAFLPQFVDASRGDAPWQFALLGAVFIAQVWACFSAVALASGWLGERLRRSERAAGAMRIAASIVLVALGLHLALSDRTP